MFWKSLINYCNSLQTQTKVAIAGAAAVCSAAFALWYYAKRSENDARTVVVLDTEQNTELLTITKSEDALRVMSTAYSKPSSSDVKPKEGGQLCLIDPSIEIYLDISTIPEIGALQLLQRKNSASTNGRKTANDHELVCAELYRRQRERNELVLQVKELVCAEFHSREQANCSERSLLDAKQSTGIEGKGFTREKQNVPTEIDANKVGLELVKFSSGLYPPLNRCDSSEKGDNKVKDVTEQQVVSDEDEILFIDASAWRDQEVDDEINFLTWLQSVEEGKRAHVESKVNLNRQRERLSRARETEVRRFYENCKNNAYDYQSQYKTSEGGVRYGHSTFSVAEEKPYKYKPE